MSHHENCFGTSSQVTENEIICWILTKEPSSNFTVPSRSLEIHNATLLWHYLVNHSVTSTLSFQMTAMWELQGAFILMLPGDPSQSNSHSDFSVGSPYNCGFIVTLFGESLQCNALSNFNIESSVDSHVRITR